MTEALPEPPVPADADLRGLPFMPLYGHQLFASDFNARASDTGWRAAVTLWWQAWNQVPAGSLPDDDVILCRLADLGRDARTWRRIKGEALAGFVKHADGRLYAPFLAKLACEAWERRVAERDRKAKWRASRDGAGDGDNPATSPSPPPDAEPGEGRGQKPASASRDGQSALKGQGQGEGQGFKRKKDPVPSEPTGSAAPPPSPGAISPENGSLSDLRLKQLPLPHRTPPASSADEKNGQSDGTDAARPIMLAEIQPEGGDWSKALFRQGLDWLSRSTGKTPNALRGLVGNWLKTAQQDHRAVFEKLAECEKLGIAEPVAWLTKTFAMKTGTSGAQASIVDEAKLRARLEAAQENA